MVLLPRGFLVLQVIFFSLVGYPTGLYAWTVIPTSLISRTSSTAALGSNHPCHQLQQSLLFGKRRRRNSKDNARYSDEDNDRNHEEDSLSPQQARTDIRNFLTQRALQSFIFLLYNLRDGATIRWLQETYQDLVNIEHYHGTGALNLTKWNTWDSILTDMLFRENEVVVISAKRRRGQGGWSKNNPYIKEEYVDFEIDIDPVSIVSRIISVRDQIAGEWKADLDTFIAANEMILDAYHEAQDSQRAQEEQAIQEKKQKKKNSKKVEKQNEKELDEEMVSSSDISNSTNATVKISYEDKMKEHSKKKAYDRSAMMVLGNNIVQDGRASSPFRKGSFDLLGLLATQESIHRVLREYQEAGEERDVSFHWLREFYIGRLPKYFDGNQEYHRADDFLEELLLSTPSLKEMDGKIGIVDPIRIAEDIIAMRTEVALDWKDVISVVPAKDHARMRKVILAIQMGKTIQKTAAIEESTSSFIFEEESFQ